MMVRGREPRAVLEPFIRAVIVKPTFAWFEAGDDGVACFSRMLGGMLTGRSIAAPDVATLGAAP
jgi:hypothetical protein